jgi:hypothetical protein
MSLLHYRQARPWAKSIRDEVYARTMPPWRADPRHGHFANDPRLSDDEVQTIVRWAERGAPEGPQAALPSPPRFDSAYAIGRPDVELVPDKGFAVPERGDLELQYFVLGEADPNRNEDRWVTAAEMRPGVRAVVHHAAVYMIAPPHGTLPPRSDVAHACDHAAPPAVPQGRRDYLFSWSPGSPAFVAPAGGARLLPRGARLLLEVHYTTNGKAAVDRTTVALRFAKRAPAERIDTVVAENRAIDIPAREADYRASACVEFARPVRLLELKPHMHLRGRAMSFTLVEGDHREILLSVPDWSFDWQLSYRLARPRDIPAGARIVVDARYDNSAANKANPAPDQEVLWDDWWRAEMLAGMITYILP